MIASIGTLAIAALIIGIMGSTKEQRSEAATRLARYNGRLWLATAAILTVLFFPYP